MKFLIAALLLPLPLIMLVQEIALTSPFWMAFQYGLVAVGIYYPIILAYNEEGEAWHTRIGMILGLLWMVVVLLIFRTDMANITPVDNPNRLIVLLNLFIMWLVPLALLVIAPLRNRLRNIL